MTASPDDLPRVFVVCAATSLGLKGVIAVTDTMDEATAVANQFLRKHADKPGLVARVIEAPYFRESAGNAGGGADGPEITVQ